ncbi:hypothetical protein C6P42_004596 [Pichia californica]|nr:hypothetical protein C6P42_004596 [[Candida] californica]
MSEDPSAFGNRGTTAIFAIIVSFAVVVLIILAFFSYKYTLRAMYGVYDPIFKSNTRYSYMFETDMPARIIQPYVFYNGIHYFMFGNNNNNINNNLSRFRNRQRIKKIELLSQDQLNEMFPLKSYLNWLNGGKDEIIKNLTNGKLGYKEQFENANEEESAQVDENIITNSSNDVELQLIKSTNKDNFIIDNIKNNNKSVIEVGSIPGEETDITDMLPGSKVEYIVTSDSNPSNINNNNNSNNTNGNINTEKHFTSGICTICLDTFEDDDSVRGLICGHVFHQICIDPWLTTRSASCPICKKDLYIEIPVSTVEGEQQDTENPDNNSNNNVNQTEENSNDSRLNFNMNEIIHLPVGEPGDTELDDLFNIQENNIFSFFIILIITRLQAQILLTALIYLRNNNYSLNSSINEINNNSNNSNNSNSTIELNFQPHEQLNALFYSDQITSRFDQKNATDSFNTPPIPDINNLNPYIKKIVENIPRPFNSSDLIDLDYEAWKETKRMRRGPKRLYYFAIGITKLQIYYYNVIKIYNMRRRERLHL